MNNSINNDLSRADELICLISRAKDKPSFVRELLNKAKELESKQENRHETSNNT